jgi:thiamine monophosphate kinase
MREDDYQYALSAGDDYEICCCVPPGYEADIDNWNNQHPNCRLTIIGEVTETDFMLVAGQQLIDLGKSQGYRHFE